MTSWVTREQEELIAYLKEENRVLREQLAGKRIRFTEDQRAADPGNHDGEGGREVWDTNNRPNTRFFPYNGHCPGA